MSEPVSDGSLVDSGDVEQPQASAADALLRLMSEDRAVTDQELILAGVVDQLGAGARTAEEILAGLLAVWPGTGLNAVRLSTALESAERAQLVVRSEQPGGVELWSLTPDGSLELELTRTWREETGARTREQVRAAAVEAFGTDPGSARVERWALLIEQAIRAGVRESGGVFAGDITAVGMSALLPGAADVGAIREALCVDDSPEEVRQFLLGCVAAALDVADPFGTEMVNTIVVGFILHATVARRDLAGSASAMGSLAGQRLVLDTPVLIRLIGPPSLAAPTAQILRSAVAVGMEVVVADHTLYELVSSLEHARLTSLPENRAAMTTPEVAAFGRLVDNDIVALAAAAVAEGRYEYWESFEEAGRSIRPYLTELGVTCRPHGNHDPSTVAECRQALVSELAARDRHRALANIDRDADTMAMAWRVRRRTSLSSTWPGAWVITSDTCIAPAMNAVEESGQWPFTLSMPQLAALIARCADVPSIAELTLAAAALATHDAGDALACRYPLAVAGELAHALTEGSAASDTDIRIAQAGLRGALSTSDISDPAIVASRVMASRQRRIKLASDSHTEAMKAQMTAAQDQVRARENELRHDKEQIKELQAEVEAEREQTNRVQLRLADVEADEELKAKQRARGRVLDLVIVLHVFAFMLLLVYDHPAVAVLAAVSALILWARLRTWVRDGRATFVQVLVAAAPDLVTVGLFVWSVLKH